jgi:ubiquinone biosynthesis protein Coq4
MTSRFEAVAAFARGVRLFLKVARDPNDTRAATDGTVLVNALVLPRIRRRFEADATGRRLLADKPLLDGRGVDFNALAALPRGTLGRALADFYAGRDIDPNAFQDMPAGVEGDDAYVALRLRQSHDLWHLVTEIGTDVPGEIELQAFAFGQLHTPSALMLGFAGAIQREREHPGLLRRCLRAYMRGRRAEPLAIVRWEDLFEMRVEEVRAALLSA